MNTAITLRSAAAGLLSLVLAPASAFAQYELDSGRAFAATGDGRALALADVDEDGRRDMIVPGGFGLYAHSVRDPFAPPLDSISWPVAGTVATLAAGDVDADGHVDVVVAAENGGASEVSVLFGNGRGSVAFAVALSMSGEIPSVALLDANGDGLLDIAAALEQSRTVALVLQNASAPRSFFAPVTGPSGGSGLHLAAGDFDGDGAADVVAASQSARTFTLLGGDGTGAFASVRTFPRNLPMTAIAAADVDRDGLTDVIATDFFLFVLRGDGVAGLVPGWKSTQAATYTSLDLGSLDGDGFVDAATAGGLLTLWRGDGAGQFVSFDALDPRSGALGIGDVDGDGVADVVGARPDSGAVDFLARTTAGGFLLPERPTGTMLGHGAASDVNGDGTLDLVFAGATRLYFFYGDGLGGLLAPSFASVRRPPNHLVGADVVGSPAMDLVSTNTANSALTIYAGDGQGFVDLGDTIVLAGSGESAAGDFDADGAADVATSSRSDQSLSIAYGDGTGSFVATTVAVGSPQESVAAGDLDGDGAADAVVARADGAGVTILFGVPDRSFSAPVTIAVGPSPRGLVIADVDEDGLADVLVGDAAERALRILHGDGARGFARRATLATPLPPVAVELGDASDDGFVDIVVAHGVGRAISVLPGYGRGRFDSARAAFRTLGDATSTLVTDLGEDGVPEIVVPGNGGSASLCRFRETPLAAALRGTVDAGRGPSRDVLLVEGRSGGSSRVVRFGTSDGMAVVVTAPPAAVPPVPLAMYAWVVPPTHGSVRELPGGLGAIALPMPLVPGIPMPRAIWNSIGRTNRLGAPTRPSSGAPANLFRAPNGVGLAITFTMQGIILDPGAPNGRAAVTNGVVVEIR